MKITIDSDLGGVYEFEGPSVQALKDASAWVMERIRARRATTCTLHIEFQMERIRGRCYFYERCVNGRWSTPQRVKEISDPEPFDKVLVHREQLDLKELRQALSTTNNTVQVAAAKREELNSFCPGALDLGR